MSFEEGVMECEEAVSDWKVPSAKRIVGTVVGTLLGFDETGAIPLVSFEGMLQSAAVRARSVLDLHGAHIGRPVVLTFEKGDVRLPIILGCMSGRCPSASADHQVAQVEADGERCVITARNQLVLRCGTASITLTKEGKILIQGAYVSSRSSGVNRIKGGVIQLN